MTDRMPRYSDSNSHFDGLSRKGYCEMVEFALIYILAVKR
jgi:hypothetical protein